MSKQNVYLVVLKDNGPEGKPTEIHVIAENGMLAIQRAELRHTNRGARPVVSYVVDEVRLIASNVFLPIG